MARRALPRGMVDEAFLDVAAECSGMNMAWLWLGFDCDLD